MCVLIRVPADRILLLAISINFTCLVDGKGCRPVLRIRERFNKMREIVLAVLGPRLIISETVRGLLSEKNFRCNFPYLICTVIHPGGMKLAFQK